MKVVRLYHKPPSVEGDNHKVYLRKMQGSVLCALVICPNEEDYNELRNKDLSRVYKDSSPYSQFGNYKEGKIVVIKDVYYDYSLHIYTDNYHINRRVAFSESLKHIYKTINNRMEVAKSLTYEGLEPTDYDMLHDIILAYSKWNTNVISIKQCITQKVVATTIDEHNTLFWQYPKENVTSYYGSDELGSGDQISFEAINYRNDCGNCSAVEYGDDSYFHYIEREDCHVCESCYDDYCTCEGCEDQVHCEDTYSRGDYVYCGSCYSESGDHIHSYSYSPDLTFYDYRSSRVIPVSKKDSKVPFYGVELEVECFGGSRGEFAEEIECYSNYQKYFYCKEDGSLEHGFEICFMPMTFNAIKNIDLYTAIFRHRGRNKLQSYNTSSCGIHIHINREAFSDHHLFKFISFIHEFKSLVYLISQRKKVSELNSYAKFNNSFKDRAKKEMVSSIKRKKADYSEHNINTKKHSTAIYGDKYVPVNLQHTHTIEVRIFKGNLMEDSFRKNIEFVDSLYYFTKNNPIYKLKVREYLDYVYRELKTYPNLNSFIEKNSNKVKEIVNFPLSVPEGLNY